MKTRFGKTDRPEISRVSDQVREIIAQRLNLMPDEIADESRLGADLGADSLVEVELVIALEQQFDIDLFDEDVEHLNTVGDLVVRVREICLARDVRT